MIEVNPSTMPVSPAAALRTRIVALSLRTLPRMLMPERPVFCLELAKDNRPPEFHPLRSWRYTIMCLLGLERAHRAGLSSGLDLKALLEATVQASSQFAAGDLGLLLWLTVRMQSSHADAVAAALEKRWPQTNPDSLEGMEVAWIIAGTAAHAQSLGAGESKIGRLMVDYFFQHRISPSGLSWHFGRGWRKRFPNFATQIYSLHALSLRARLLGDERCAQQAIRIAGRLKNLQRDNGGWPWLYDAARGIVVEPFEVYSVHQHAMGPMALIELHEATGCDVQDMLERSLGWLEARNELQFPMIDEGTGLIYRSIRRTPPRDRLAIYTRTLKSLAGLSPGWATEQDISGLEINLTCRPYELGWLLEAWAGRETLTGRGSKLP